MYNAPFCQYLLGAEDPVAGVAQTGDDIGMLIELLVDGSQIQVYIGMGFVYSLDALGTADAVYHKVRPPDKTGH